MRSVRKRSLLEVNEHFEHKRNTNYFLDILYFIDLS